MFHVKYCVKTDVRMQCWGRMQRRGEISPAGTARHAGAAAELTPQHGRLLPPLASAAGMLPQHLR